MRVLVSGVGGDIGMGLGRMLRAWNLCQHLYGIDVSRDHPASLVFDEVDVSPHAFDSSYLSWLARYIELKEINVFVPTSEAEIWAISRESSRLPPSCKLLINDSTLVETTLDKHKTLMFLESFGIPVPMHGVVGNTEKPHSYPVIVKPRSGQGSKGLQKVASEQDFLKCDEGLVWQQLLEPDDEEYTCAVFVSKTQQCRVLLLKRVLIGGSTGRAVVVTNAEIESYIEEIISAFGVSGLFNVQLRLTSEGPKLFEVNPRVSSTVVFRDKVGFQDFKWWFSELIGLEVAPYHGVPAGVSYYRGTTEYVMYPGEKGVAWQV